VTTLGILSTICGDGTSANMGDGGAATSAQISFPIGLRTTDGDEIITGTGLYTIRKIDTSGDISTIAGTGVQGSPPAGDGGPATSATLYQVQDLALNSAGEIFISDGNYPVRFIDGSGIIDTVIDGGLDSYLNIQFLIFDQTGTDLYFTDSLKIFRLSGGVITEVAGSGTTGYTGDGGPAVDADITVDHLTLDTDGNIYFCSLVHHVIRKIDTSGDISTIAGSGSPGYSGDGGPAVDAELEFPIALTYHDGALYFCDQTASCIRKINLATGNISLFAGTPGTTGFGGDGGPAHL
jgi:hypothetical protein